jgi:hypothetical protein
LLAALCPPGFLHLPYQLWNQHRTGALITKQASEASKLHHPNWVSSLHSQTNPSATFYFLLCNGASLNPRTQLSELLILSL